MTEKRAERRMAAGAALVFGANTETVAELEAAEREAERRADSLNAAVELAKAELSKLEELERRAVETAKQEHRAAVVDELRKIAGLVDALFTEVAEKLGRIDELMKEYRAAGGIFSRSMKGCTTRAALAGGLRGYLETEHVGNVNILRPLAEQFEALNSAPSVDLSVEPVNGSGEYTE